MTPEQQSTLIEEIKRHLAEFFREDSEQILNDLINDYTAIALDYSNNQKIDRLRPYIKKSVIMAYKRIGFEQLQSYSENGFQGVFIDIEEKLQDSSMSIRKLDWS